MNSTLRKMGGVKTVKTDKNLKPTKKVLIIDDETELLSVLKEFFEKDGYSVDIAETGTEGLTLFNRNRHDIVIVDIALDDMDGTEVMQQVKQTRPETSLIIITGYGSIKGEVQCMKHGADNYLRKPLDYIELLKIANRLIENKYLTQRTEALKQQLLRRDAPIIVGNTKAIRKVMKDIETVATSNVPVLVTGESGTGKELVAMTIHNLSARCNEPFIPINCAAIPHDLLESEFFGHEKGAFSGATKRKYGLFEVADRGTLFLDEIGDMPVDLQAKLLRAVDDNYIRRTGGTEQIKVDVRFICSTNRDIKKLLKSGLFREDLYYRLNTMIIDLPPLRKRKRDIPLLIDFLLEKHGRKDYVLPANVLEALKKYTWPGNVRELENCLERILLTSNGKAPCIDSLTADIQQNYHQNNCQGSHCNKEYVPLSEMEKKYIIEVFDHCQGDKTKTARVLGIGVRTLYRKLASYGIE